MLQRNERAKVLALFFNDLGGPDVAESMRLHGFRANCTVEVQMDSPPGSANASPRCGSSKGFEVA
jgi:hypothetical protein